MIEKKNATIIKPVIYAWLLAGTLDLAGACIHYYFKNGRNPIVIPRYIASAIFGPGALAGGLPMLLAGTIMHYLIALAWTLLFFFLVPKIRILSKNLFWAGMLYGLLVWAVMNFVLLPMTRLQLPQGFDPVKALIPALTIMFCIGLPVALIAGKYYRRHPNS